MTRAPRHLGERSDALCVTVATIVAVLGALGVTDVLPFSIEDVGIAADLGAGLFALSHALAHHIRRR
jgi:hypothetical protein